MFSFLPNHWVSKETIHEQIVEIETYRVAICIDKSLSKESKLLILLDVYVCYWHLGYMECLKNIFLHIIFTLFIPTNLTETGQLMDRYLKACLKRILD